jgi:CMP-N,N'-diacetyllegionaminic acid synthase
MSARVPVLATICARGGSKGVPGKNLRELGGRPLIAYTIDCARACPDVDAVVVSTDDERIARAAEACGIEVPFRRPAEMASDTAAKLPVIRHATRWMQENRAFRAEIVLDLDVTVPLRAPEDVAACVAEFERVGWDAVITVYAPERNPYFNMVEMGETGARVVKEPPKPIFRRQDAPRVYSTTPAVFGFRRELLDRTDYIYDGRVGIVEVPRERAVDIDHEMDFEFAEFLLRRRMAKA